VPIAGFCVGFFNADIFLHFPAFGCILSPVSEFMLHCTCIIQHSGGWEGDGQGRNPRFINPALRHPAA
jgi:hypothetical protein